MLADVFVHDTEFWIGGVQLWPPSPLVVVLVIVSIAALVGGIVAIASTRR